jgi:monoterpene epsilon-lactone hydrolase
MAGAAAAEVFKMNQDLLAAWTADPDATMDDMRRVFEEHMGQIAIPEGTSFEPVDAGGVSAIWATAPDAGDDRIVIHHHSGGLVLGSAEGYRAFGGELSAATGGRVLLLDYRLAPEDPAPAALEDGLAAYRWVVDQGVDPGRIVISGDSAGGGLALSVLQGIRDQGGGRPAAGVIVSPVADWTFSGESMTTNAALDPLVPGPAMLEGMRGMVVPDGWDHQDWRVSPLFGDWSGLPPLLLYAGSIECLRDDARRCADAAASAGVEAVYVEGEDMCHIWPVYADRLPEARQALDQIGAFVETRLATAAA